MSGATLDTGVWALFSKDGRTWREERVTAAPFDMRAAPIARGCFVGTSALHEAAIVRPQVGQPGCAGKVIPTVAPAGEGRLASRQQPVRPAPCLSCTVRDSWRRTGSEVEAAVPRGDAAHPHGVDHRLLDGPQATRVVLAVEVLHEDQVVLGVGAAAATPGAPTSAAAAPTATAGVRIPRARPVSVSCLVTAQVPDRARARSTSVQRAGSGAATGLTSAGRGALCGTRCWETSGSSSPAPARRASAADARPGRRVWRERGGARARGEGHRWAIGVDEDQYDTVQFLNGVLDPDRWRRHILTSVVKAQDRTVYELVEDAEDGRIAPGVREVGLADDAVALAWTGGHLDAHREQLDLLRASVVAGRVQVPHVPR